MNAKSGFKLDKKIKSLKGFNVLEQKVQYLPEDKIVEAKKRDCEDAPGQGHKKNQEKSGDRHCYRGMVLSLPHSGVWLPRLAVGHIAKGRFLLLDTDLYTDQVFARVRQKSSFVVTGVSPYVVNCNKARKSKVKPIIPRHFLYGQPVLLDSYTALESRELIKNYYDRYHFLLDKLIRETKRRVGYCLVIDGHSLSELGGPQTVDPGELRADFTLGDNFGKSANTQLSRHLAASLKKLSPGQKWSVKTNHPYAGDFITKHYGRPSNNVHVIQIEINKKLYLRDSAIEGERLTRQDFSLNKTGLKVLAGVLDRAIDSLQQKTKRLYA